MGTRFANRVGEPTGKIHAFRDEQREVVETGVAVRRSCAGLLDENRGRPRPRAPSLGRPSSTTSRPTLFPVVLERAPEVGNGELNRAECHTRRNLGRVDLRARLDLLRIPRRVRTHPLLGAGVLPHRDSVLGGTERRSPKRAVVGTNAY